jgi:hypothetical protein
VDLMSYGVKSTLPTVGCCREVTKTLRFIL